MNHPPRSRFQLQEQPMQTTTSTIYLPILRITSTSLYHTLLSLFTTYIALLFPPLGTWLIRGYPTWGLAIDILLCFCSLHYMARLQTLVLVGWRVWLGVREWRMVRWEVKGCGAPSRGWERGYPYQWGVGEVEWDQEIRGAPSGGGYGGVRMAGNSARFGNSGAVGGGGGFGAIEGNGEFARSAAVERDAEVGRSAGRGRTGQARSAERSGREVERDAGVVRIAEVGRSAQVSKPVHTSGYAYRHGYAHASSAANDFVSVYVSEHGSAQSSSHSSRVSMGTSGQR